ncbi:UDP-N-acetylmuramoylalanyl-D-glutamate--2,6-diaminopimelate ligase [Massilia sp. WF1]|uniref:UDP-N-acetylmuramoyl-L-alanyl-D-glutamate--2, 6-diaminopimelate ligase n=1 Tax=unclassified Massilia TaxID=2609279 RepID=UPI000689AAEF|nr:MULTISPECIES: UDP-N-acetylmuramoyl-L-alanyl-D-glutamate--2,6-diaminopimelate ligase [unclassified Massilia]ALK95861.1 UDP-N-acetylmuramoyl-L-alanyl-D-glutamate--2,6-diaminopimelate ligase [Massilia sp. WG5]KNZ67918.1 UDP-N-acetylmuramoylalanyl-D-glutamate--2,6-diaminopimelate ligase [Massilia sp. WF1]
MTSLDDICQWIRAAAPGGRLVSDSRRVGRGDVFFAYPGEGAADGRNYIGSAIEKGAAAVVHEGRDFVWNATLDVPHLALPELKKNAGVIAHAYYGQPDAAMFTVGVTGTNGKTSIALWTAQALARLGSVDEAVGVIGTLGVGLVRARVEPEFDATGYTTPDAVLLATRLASLRDAGARALAIEVSSIGLVEERTAGMHFDVAVFTNLTRDHLDYHGDMASYEAAKLKLFQWPGLKHAVLNLDDPAGGRIAAHLRANRPEVALTGYTLRSEEEQPEIEGIAILRASQLRSRPAGTEFHVDAPAGSALARTRLVGHFNASNALAVLGVLLARGAALRAALEVLETLEPAPGRMQQIGGLEAPLVVIDYAHTPDALEKALVALRQVAIDRGGQLWCVFGCGGDRDPGKRPQMGAIAQMADHVLVTSDNPRSEEPRAIIEQIVAGMDPCHPSSTQQAIEDRAAAILSAVKHAGKPDVILLAGKGHEPYQEIKGRKMPFSDADHAALALTARLTMMRNN